MWLHPVCLTGDTLKNPIRGCVHHVIGEAQHADQQARQKATGQQACITTLTPSAIGISKTWQAGTCLRLTGYNDIQILDGISTAVINPDLPNG
jgi:hypothetical protein